MDGDQLVTIADFDTSRVNFGDVNTKQIKDSKGRVKLNWTKSLSISETYEFHGPLRRKKKPRRKRPNPKIKSKRSTR